MLLILCIVGFWLFENFYTPDTYSEPRNGENTTEILGEFIPTSTTGTIIAHNHFILSYHETYEQAEWVAYTLKKEHLTYDDRERPYYIEDPKVKSKSADWRNYRGSGFDRGHLCPAGDRRFSEYAYNETFYTSNISPQDRDFNAGVWNRLEMQTRAWCKRYGTLFVVTAGILENGLDEIGEEDVAVPRYFYKIVARGNEKNIKIAAFLIPNYESQASLREFLVPVDKIEQLTGIDFFKQLPDSMEDGVEGKVDASAWKF
jgi:endonuclease G